MLKFNQVDFDANQVNSEAKWNTRNALLFNDTTNRVIDANGIYMNDLSNLMSGVSGASVSPLLAGDPADSNITASGGPCFLTPMAP